MSISAKQVPDILQKYILADGMRPIFDADKSHDSYMHDGSSGKDYLDLFSFFATQPLAYNHPKINTPAFREKIGRIAIHRPTLSDIYVPEFAEFVETFAKIAGKGYFKHYFFIEGGAMGVENALKVAMDWKVRKNLKRGKGEKGNQIIHFRDAFHGRSGYTVSMTNTFHAKKHQYFAKLDWPRVTPPFLTFPVTEQIRDQVIAAEKQTVEQIKNALKQNPDEIAALILEPIQCEGGDNHFRKEFFQTLRNLADEHEFLLILDEVQTGIGITGKMWAFEHFGIVPDLVSFGKKVQVAGCASTGRIDDEPENAFKVSSRINSTWGGNLVDMVRCQKLLEIIEEDNLVDHADKMGNYFIEQLHGLAGRHASITNIRGRGLLIAFDLPTPEKRDQMMKNMYANGAISLSSGTRSIRLRPHLDIKKTEIDHAIEIMDKSVA